MSDPFAPPRVGGTGWVLRPRGGEPIPRNRALGSFRIGGAKRRGLRLTGPPMSNPFAPPSAPLDNPTPRPTRSRWAALWWFPTVIFGFFTVVLLLATGLGAFKATYDYWASGGNIRGGSPPVYRTAVETLVMGGACIGFGLIAHSWWRRRWALALALMALLYGLGLLAALRLRGH